MVTRCLESCNKNFLIGAPTIGQVRRIYWQDMKLLVPEAAVRWKSEVDMTIGFWNGVKLALHGMEAPERVEGTIWHGALLDEVGNMRARVLSEVLSPALADTKGFLWALGVPEGRNHYFDSVTDIKLGLWGDDAMVFHWPSWEIMDEEEINRERSKLDALTFSQEYGGEFLDFAGRAYYAYSHDEHSADLRHLYDPTADLIFCFDFNVDPGVAAICQEVNLPSNRHGTAVIGEVFVPKNSNTEVVARKLVDDWKDHRGRVLLYGDFTGGARGSAKTAGSDWEIISQVLRPVFGGRINNRVKFNPPVRDRINAMNSRLKSVNGDIRLMVDKKHALHVMKDLDGVTLLEGSAGEIDKKSAPMLTHISDALGYYIAAEFGFNKHETHVGRGARFAA